jgi:hypothetical protein
MAAGVQTVEAFIPAVAVGTVEPWIANAYYPSDEALPSYLVLLEHALRFALEEGGDPGIDTCTTRGCDYGQPTAQILIDPNSQLANPGFLGLCPFFGTPGKVVFHRVLEFLTQFLWCAAIEINDILDADISQARLLGFL